MDIPGKKNRCRAKAQTSPSPRPREPIPESIEIRVLPDGRVYVDGLSKEILEILNRINPDDRNAAERLELLQRRRVEESRIQSKEQ